MQTDKIYISPNYTKLEKKIAEYRESRLLRSYREKEVLYNKGGQGFEVRRRVRVREGAVSTHRPPAPLPVLDEEP